MTENVIFPKSYVVKHTDSLKKKKKKADFYIAISEWRVLTDCTTI